MAGRKNRKVPAETFGGSAIDSLKEFVEGGDTGETITVRRMKLNLEPRMYSPEEIKWTREKQMRVSQAVFAQLFGVSIKTVEAWECGRNKPSGPVFRLLEEININPMAFLKRHLGRSAESLEGKITKSVRALPVN